jgi:hypothetical protein
MPSLPLHSKTDATYETSSRIMAASSGSAADKAPADAEDEFGSFAAAERLSDPFGDVYGADADFVGGSSEAAGPPAATNSSSPFSPLTAPAAATAPPTLLPSISGEVDPFADITGGLGAVVNASSKKTETKRDFGSDSTSLKAVAATPTSTSSILDLVWGSSSQETELNPLSMSNSSVEGKTSRTAANPSGFVLPPPPATKFATFPSATRTPEAATGDLLSFSPVQASAPSDPFFGITNNASETTAPTPAFGNDELFAMTETPPLSAASSSAPTSLHGSFSSLHEDVNSSAALSSAPEVKTSPRDLNAERTTRSFGSLSSSFVSVGAMEESAGHNGAHASISTFTGASAGETTISTTTPSPSSAPPSLHSSFKISDRFLGFASTTDEADEVDPFAEAGLAAPEEVPLAEALAAWSSSAEPVVDSDEEKTQVSASDEVAQSVEKQQSLDESSDDIGSAVEEEEPHGVLTAASTERNIKVAANDGSEVEQHIPSVSVSQLSGDVIESEAQAFDESLEPFDVAGGSASVEGMAVDANEEIHALGLQDSAFEDDQCESDGAEDAGSLVSGNEIVWPAPQHFVEETNDSVEEEQADSFALAAAAEVSDDAQQQHDPFGAPPSANDNALEAFAVSSDQPNDDTAAESNDGSDAKQVIDGDVDFDDFGGFEAGSAPTIDASIVPDASPWDSVPLPTPVQSVPTGDEVSDDGFGDFAVAPPSTAAENPASATVANDGFADFAQGVEPSGSDDFGDFGDFSQTSINDAQGFTDFQQSASPGFGADDDDFGDFAPAVTPATVVAPLALEAPSFSKTELSTFFKEAFATDPVPISSVSQPGSPTDVADTDIVQDMSMDFVQDVFRSMCDEYAYIIASTGRQSSSSLGSLSSGPDSRDNGEGARANKKCTRASKYLKYVLSEKIQEASRQNGIFPHGSERHQMYVEFAASGDADRMRAALKELQDALFHNSVNDAMMRIAKQAALSAKAKIAEQAAQQQANSRGGSLFSTTRHLLSRGAAGTHGPGSSGNDAKSDHTGADTPTGASVQKLARFSFTNSHDDAASAHRGVNGGEERGSEGSDHTGHSSGSDSEAAASAGDSRTRSQTLSNSGGGNGGLMKKFQDRFSFASSRHRPRFVSLRRKGQSGEEVRKMELNLDAISGGLDEVKWKCAMFMYDVEEVTHVAPSQIKILSYPSKLPLTGKTDRSALSKMVKPDTIWTVDIGANNSDMLNEW